MNRDRHYETSRMAGHTILWLTGVWLLASPVLAHAQLSDVDGLTEPYRTVDVAAPEPGIVTQVHVREGEAVRQGQILASLDNDVHFASLAVAQKSMEAVGALNSALAEVQLRRERLEKLKTLRAEEHARQEEVDRARAELAIAEARVVSVHEDLAIKKLEYDKIKAQIARRIIRSPVDGIVSKALKDEGEYAAANDPTLFSVVQLHQLLAVFAVPSPGTRELSVDQKVQVRYPDLASPVPGTVEFVSPVTDAESGTVRVKVRIDNPQGNFRSGERCTLELAAAKRDTNRPQPVAKQTTSPRGR
jgi:RND family efflux transporter MFP subunit